jgi:hypothetical protein
LAQRNLAYNLFRLDISQAGEYRLSLIHDGNHPIPDDSLNLAQVVCIAGSNYQTILNEIRSEIAKDYLNSSLPIEKIAEMLGFSEASAFSNAFKTWESISPKDYRLNNR